MSKELNSAKTTEEYLLLETLIGRFCDIILIKGDKWSFEKAVSFVESLTDNDKSSLNADEPEKDHRIRLMIQRRVASYLKTFDYSSDASKVSRPFEFDSGGEYINFCDYIENLYRENNQRANFPPVLSFTCKYIQDMSEHYRIFAHFYDVRSRETSQKILNDMEKKADIAAKKAVDKATADTAKKAVNAQIKQEMHKVSNDITKISVTILGIFSGIVLTVVAGLFYSSSVLENINATNFCRLVCIASLVGIVCIDLLVVMFKYIEKIKNGKEKANNSFWDTLKSNAWPIFLNVLLIIIMIASGVLQLKFPENQSNTANPESKISVNATVDVSNNESSSTEETTETMPSNTNEAK